MTTPSRTQQFTRLHELLARQYKPRPADPGLPVLEHLMFAAVLENARHAVAERVFQVLKTEFFDWNEIRVCTIRDLSEAGEGLPDPAAAATRIKYPLQHIFESTYSFDMEDLRKLTLGQAIERLQKIEGVSRFMVSYVVQNALGGHTIPLDMASLRVLNLLGLADESEVASGTVAGLERAIPKSKGVEFAWLLHEFAAEFWADHHAPVVAKVFKALDPQALERLEAWEQGLLQPATTAAAETAPPPTPVAQAEATRVVEPKRRGRPKKVEGAPSTSEQPSEAEKLASGQPADAMRAQPVEAEPAGEAAGSPPKKASRKKSESKPKTARAKSAKTSRSATEEKAAKGEKKKKRGGSQRG
ncbi:MAG: hypothetical protein WHT09_06610 [Thermogutta sp.]